MIVKSLELDFFRNYLHFQSEFDPRVNLIYGENAREKPICWRPLPICPPPNPTGSGMTGR